MSYSITARHISTWDRLEVEPGPDRLIIKGETDATSRTSHGTSLGLRYDQIDALVRDLLTAKRDHAKREVAEASDCTCVFSCAEDPATRCALTGEWHVHPDDGTGVFGLCPAHPDAPGDL